MVTMMSRRFCLACCTAIGSVENMSLPSAPTAVLDSRCCRWRFSHFRIGTELEHNPFLALARALAPLYELRCEAGQDNGRVRARCDRLATTGFRARLFRAAIVDREVLDNDRTGGDALDLSQLLRDRIYRLSLQTAVRSTTRREGRARPSFMTAPKSGCTQDELYE